MTYVGLKWKHDIVVHDIIGCFRIESFVDLVEGAVIAKEGAWRFEAPPEPCSFPF